MSLLDRYMDDLESRREKEAGSDPSDYEDVGGVAVSPESAAGDTVVFKAADIKLALSRPPPPVPDDAASVYSTTSELGAPVGSVSPPAPAAAPPPPPPPSAESPRNRVAAPRRTRVSASARYRVAVPPRHRAIVPPRHRIAGHRAASLRYRTTTP